MADLKPLGSEKLQGMEKIQRIMEIARFKETIPTPINETSKSEYNLTLADGNNYQIVREKNGYIIKCAINENTVDYIAPMKDRKYYRSYSDALKRLNLMAKEMNSLYGNEAGTSLFSEQKKYVLKTPNQQTDMTISDDVENVPAPSPAPAEPMAPAPEMGGDDMETDDMPMGGDEMGSEDMGGEEPITPSLGGEEGTSLKLIQKLTGKLAQKLRVFASDDANKLTSKDIKYVINSILSALNLDDLSDEDKEDILNKFEGIEAEESMDSEDMGGEDMDSEDMSGEDMPMGDETGSEEMSSELGEEESDDTHIGSIADSIFMESSVDKVLSKYFKLTESEKKQKIKVNKNNLDSQITKLSESKKQEFRAKRFLQENKSAKLIGKTVNKNLVFEFENKKVKVATDGSLKWNI